MTDWKEPYDIIDKKEPRGQSVTYEGIPCTARTCVTRLNRLSYENEHLNEEVNKLTDLLGSEIEKNARLLQENNELKIENMRLKEIKL